MQDIKELGLKELEDKLLSWGSPKYHTKQIFNWIYQKGAFEFSSMSDLPAALRKTLADDFYILGLQLADLQQSSDGTAKFLFQLKDNNLVEAVSIPMRERSPGLIAPWHKGLPSAPLLGGSAGARLCAVTGCISSQAGCKFSCRFCASGLKGFKRNLNAGEILDEVLYLKNNSQDGTLTHIVFMGTGEPLDNYENVLKAIRVINAPHAFNIGARRITISTCGIIPAIKRLQDEELQIELSISLHSADDRLRSEVMPVNKKYPLADLIKCCHEYIAKTNRLITFEYILVKDLNSDLTSAQKLVTLLKDLKLAKVNLIAVNPVRSGAPRRGTSNGASPIPETKFMPPEKPEVISFKDYLFKAGINVTLRRERGQDIDAACGQLRLKHEKN